MYTPKKNRKNVFKNVCVQRGSKLFGRYRNLNAPPVVGSDGSIVPLDNMSKIEQMEFLKQYDDYHASLAHNHAESSKNQESNIIDSEGD